MDSENVNRFTMILAVQSYLDKHVTTWSSILAIAAMKNELDALVTETRRHITESEQLSHGLTLGKNELKEQLATKAARYSGAIQAYAAVKEMHELKEDAQLTKTAVLRTREAELPEKLEKLEQLMTTHLAELGDYGISEALVTEFSTSIDDFREVIGKPRERLSAARLANREAEENVAEMMALLTDKLDNIMLMFGGSDPLFYQGYERARVIVD